MQLLVVGGIVAAFGFAICTCVQDFWPFVLGKWFAGSGMGIFLVALNALAAAQKTEKEI